MSRYERLAKTSDDASLIDEESRLQHGLGELAAIDFTQ